MQRKNLFLLDSGFAAHVYFCCVATALLASSFTSLLVTVAIGANGSEAEDVAWLQALYHSTNGDVWASGCSEGWNLTVGATSLGCNVGDENRSAWNGVMCTSEHRLDTIHLQNCMLRGTLPEVTGAALSEAQGIWLNSNVDTNLQRLFRNQISGRLPKSWGGLPTLVQIWLANNQLTGGIPEEWAQLSRVVDQQLDLSYNCVDLVPGRTSNGVFRSWLDRVIYPTSLSTQRTDCPLLLCGRSRVRDDVTGLCDDCPRSSNCSSSTLSLITPSRNASATSSVAASSIISASGPTGSFSGSPTGTAALQFTSASVFPSISVSTHDMVAAPSSIASVVGNVVATGAVGCATAAVAGIVGGAELLSLDTTSLAALQAVRCSEFLRASSSPSALPSTSTSSSPLRFVLSPFSDFDPAIAALGNVGLMVGWFLLHVLVAVMVSWWRWGGSGGNSGRSCWQKKARTTVMFPALSLVGCVLLLPGAIRAAVVGLFTSSSPEAPTTTTSLLHHLPVYYRYAAVSVTMVSLVIVGVVWFLAWRWCRLGAGTNGLTFSLESASWTKRANTVLSSGGPCRSKLLKPLLLASLPVGEWKPRSVQRRYGPMFSSVRGMEPSWIPGAMALHAVVFAAVSAAPVGVYDAAGCSALHSVLCLLALLPAVALAWCRWPMRIRLLNAASVVTAALVAGSAMVTAVGLQQPREDSRRAAAAIVDVITVAQTVIMAVRSILLAATRLVERLLHVSDKTRCDEMETDLNTKNASRVVLVKPIDVGRCGERRRAKRTSAHRQHIVPLDDSLRTLVEAACAVAARPPSVPQTIMKCNSFVNS